MNFPSANHSMNWLMISGSPGWPANALGILSRSLPNRTRETESRWIQNENTFIFPTATWFYPCLRSLNSGWGYWNLAGVTISHMLKHTEQVGFTTRSGPLRSHPQSRAEAMHISISYTDKLAFSLPGRFPHERLKCKRFGEFRRCSPHCFSSAHRDSRGGC